MAYRIQHPLPAAELLEVNGFKSNSDLTFTVDVEMDFDSIAEHNFEHFLDTLSERITTDMIEDIDYLLVGAENGSAIIRVTAAVVEDYLY